MDTITQEALDLLKLREGWRTVVYLDSLGIPTAGLGHMLIASERILYPVGSTVPNDILNRWAQHDSQNAYNAAEDQANLLSVTDQNFINVLTSVNFQLGTRWYTKFPNTWHLLMNGEWVNAANEVASSAWYRETPVRVSDFQKAILSLQGEQA